MSRIQNTLNRSKLRPIVLALAYAVLCSKPASATDWDKMKSIVPHGYVCYRTTVPLLINGQLNDPDWKTAPWSTDFQDIEGAAMPKPAYRTRAKMLWDKHYFYVAAEIEEPNVWGTLTKRDSVIFYDNDFEVFIDPDGDHHEYYEFEMNALNTVWDLFLRKPYKDGGPAMNNWDIEGLRTAVHVQGTLNNPADHDQGWTLEIAFPWKALKPFAHRPAPPWEGDQWRVNFSRVEWDIEIVNGTYRKIPNRPEHNWVWSPQGIIDMHRPEKWGYVQFTHQPPGTILFDRDLTEPARDQLMTIYHAQREFQKQHQHWAASLVELGLEGDPGFAIGAPPDIALTKDGFVATEIVKLPSREKQRWRVRQDSKLWKE